MGEVALRSRADEWEFVAAKSRVWLARNMMGDQDPELILAQARDKLQVLHATQVDKRNDEAKRVAAQGSDSFEAAATKTVQQTITPKTVCNMINYEAFVKMMMAK